LAFPANGKRYSMSWLLRWQRRRFDLARGVDADLMQENKRRFSRTIVLFGGAGLFLLIDWRFTPSNPWHLVLTSLAILCFAAGVVSAQIAMAYDRFLRKPDSEEPPSIFKE
jgi:hypothetical protein